MDEVLGFKYYGGLEDMRARNHDKRNGVWLKIHKNGFNSNALKGSDVLDSLLCYGWITSKAKKGTNEYALWWICPRRRKSMWPEVNRNHAERLISEGRIKASGMKKI